jgi:hypothetical protein
VADSLQSLDGENADAWRLYTRLCTRLVIDAGLSGTVYEQATRDLSDEAQTDLIARLSVIHDLLQPKQEPKS